MMAVALMTGFSGVARAASSEQLDSLKEQASLSGGAGRFAAGSAG